MPVPCAHTLVSHNLFVVSDAKYQPSATFKILKKGYVRTQKSSLDAGPGQSRIANVSTPLNFGGSEKRTNRDFE